MMKAIFMGTPELAVPFLELLRTKAEIPLVVTNPDEPSGRGYEFHAPPVKQAAERLGLPVWQPTTLRDSAAASRLAALEADIGIVVAYGKLLPKDILGIPRLGFLNVHFSLLPTYRGAAPIQWALINGEARTGVTLFWLDEGMDTGPLLAQEALDIGDDDAESLRRRLVALGAEVLASALQRLEAGEVIRRPQEGASSQAPPLKKEDGRIDWNKSAASIVQLIRGTTPWPGAYTVAAMPGGRNLRVKITRATALPDDHAGAPGEIRRVESGLGFDVKCHEGLLRVEEVQPEGKKAMPAWSFWQGARLKMGDKIG